MVAAPIDGIAAGGSPVGPATPARDGSAPAAAPAGLATSNIAVTEASNAGGDPSLELDSAKALEVALNARLEKLLSTNIRLQIDKDRDTGHFIYKSIDTKTGMLHRQFPSEEILRMLAFFRELDGLLYDSEA